MKILDELKLEQLNTQIEVLLPSVSLYDKLYDERYKLRKKITKEKVENDYSNLRDKVNFIECVYPRMGSAGQNGSAYFIDKELADNFIVTLRAYHKSYYYAYVLHWNGPGKYRVEPDHNHDHDNQTVYTANFIKD